MDKFSVLTTLLLQLFRMLVEVSGQSPCPQYFTYINDPSTNQVIGQIMIPSPPKNVELLLKVGLSIAASLPSKYVGRLELTQSEEESIKIVEQGGPLIYHVHFPLSQPVPVLTSIGLNGQVYCTGHRALGSIITSIVLQHTLYPPQMLSIQNASPNVELKNTETHPGDILGIQTVKPFVPIPTTQLSNSPIESEQKLTTPRPITTTRVDSTESSKFIDISINSHIPKCFFPLCNLFSSNDST
ncbi:PREDICTED: uncharacterized protein LOC106745259 [Dinoponera quadriceps]|uniref:Uncharacterized protein LOC106745259 n=1 Tax=Dinoponera quadriceps TaxID=609295 RepID=A0A6P3XDB3_DINQU|nr:PREDICTED: uncharacterized protein LOC106745259 [Dinoponera quadriceps]